MVKARIISNVNVLFILTEISVKEEIIFHIQNIFRWKFVLIGKLITFVKNFQKKIFTKMIKSITKWFISAVMAITAISCGANTPGNSTKENVKTIHLTKAEFLKKVVNYETNSKEWKYLGDKPAIIDFYATWCGPCKTIAPILEELANEYDGQIYIYKIDTDKEQELAAAFGISAIPTILFVPMEGKPQISQGALPKENLKEIIEKFLLAKEKK